MIDRSFSMTINSTAAGSEDQTGVVNPATGHVIARVPVCTPEQLNEAMASARQAQRAWSLHDDQRREVLRNYADVLTVHAHELATMLTTEQGKPTREAVGEVEAGIGLVRDHAELSIPVETVADTVALRSDVHLRPVGVVAAITPWNFPFSIAMLKMAAAVRAGNTVIVKPSPFTPLTTLFAGELSRDVFPPGVVNVVAGGDELGALMAAHPVPRAISFTGSVATGKAIASAAAQDLKRIVLELGGNDPAIILPDADPATVAAQIAAIAFRNCGQICATIKRVYVHASIYRPVLDAITERASTITVGDGFAPDTTMGPIQNQPQYERVARLVCDARERGATVTTGGQPLDRDGYFYPPTVLANVTEGIAVVDEEQFGPALPVMPFTTEHEALYRANNTMYGLTASVWGSDPARFQHVASQLDAGVVSFNTHDLQVPGTPFGGHKWSGIGVEGGLYGLRHLTNPQVMNTTTAA